MPAEKEPGAPPSLTASFERVPAEHDGASVFTYRLRFSEPASVSLRTLRDHSFQVEGGTVTSARSVHGRDDLREIYVAPSSYGAVTVTLAGGHACDAAGGICTADGRRLANTLSATIPGPAGITVADASVREGAGARIEFAVALDRATDGTVTLDYGTADGTATAGEDFTATSGRLIFTPGETERTVVVTVLDDARFSNVRQFAGGS